jgi:hypothetical protein
VLIGTSADRINQVNQLVQKPGIFASRSDVPAELIHSAALSLFVGWS